jgi:hypothetical protein
MAGKIFYRERQKYVDSSAHPRFHVVAIHDLNLRVYGQHLRMSELKAMAEATGAELIALPRGGANAQFIALPRGRHSGQKRREAMEARA